MRSINLFAAWLVVVTVSVCPVAWGQSPQVETVVEGLASPWGVALRPPSGDIFVSDSGAGRVVAIREGKIVDAITGFSTEAFGEAPPRKIGPLGLAFLDANTLIVAEGGRPAGEDTVRLYDMAKVSGGIGAEEAKITFDPLAATEESPALGNFFGVAAIEESLVFFTALGTDRSWAVARGHVKDGRLQGVDRPIESAEEALLGAPMAITAMPGQNHLVVAEWGAGDELEGAAIAFYSARHGRRLMRLDTGLRAIMGLAYSPAGLLYAIDHSPSAPDQAGLYRLDAAGPRNQEVRATRIISLERPTALAFSADGALYVTLAGEAESPSGKLVKITGAL